MISSKCVCTSGCAEQLRGVRAARRALGIAAEHPRDLLHAIGIGEQRDVSGRDAGAGAFRDENVAMRA